jgi:hypothetical protein
MAILKGIAASFRVGANAVLDCDTWSLDIGSEFIDTTSFLDSAREQTPSYATWSGKASGRYDIADTTGQLALQTAALGQTVVDARFYVDGSNYYHGNGYVQMTVEAAVEGYVAISYEITQSGALSYN